MHVCAHTYINTCTHTQALTHTHTHTHICTHACTHAHTCTHARMHAHTHTHTHTHTKGVVLLSICQCQFLQLAAHLHPNLTVCKQIFHIIFYNYLPMVRSVISNLFRAFLTNCYKSFILPLPTPHPPPPPNCATVCCSLCCILFLCLCCMFIANCHRNFYN